MEELSLRVIGIYIISFVLSVFLPDYYIPEILKRCRKILGEVKDEKDKWRSLPKFLGQIERALFWAFLLLFPSQFAIFLATWLALKTAGGYQIWHKPEGKEDKHAIHKGRAKFIMFLIGSGLSILSVVAIYYLTPTIINFLICFKDRVINIIF